MFYSTAAVCAAIFAYQRLQPRPNLKESEPFIPYKALLIVLSRVIYTLPLCLVPLQLYYCATRPYLYGSPYSSALFTTICVFYSIFIVAGVPVFIPDGTIISPRESIYLCQKSLISLRESLRLFPVAPCLFTGRPRIYT